ncbi:MAG: hypothetical protein AAGM22_04740 [Acidobacteriota bacterium]
MALTLAAILERELPEPLRQLLERLESSAGDRHRRLAALESGWATEIDAKLSAAEKEVVAAYAGDGDDGPPGQLPPDASPSFLTDIALMVLRSELARIRRLRMGLRPRHWEELTKWMAEVRLQIRELKELSG